MKPLFLLVAVATVALPAKEAAATTVTVETRIDSATPQVIIDRVSAVSSQLGVSGLNDLGVDEAFASADIRTGEVRFRARDGIQTGRGIGGSSTSAFGSLQETMIFAHDPALGPLIYGLELTYTSTSELFEDTFPLFNQPAAAGIGGSPQVGSVVRVSILEPVTVPGVTQPFLRSTGVLEQSVSGRLNGRVGDENPSLTNVSVTERGFGFIGNNIIGQTSQVTAIDSVVTASASTFFEGTISIDLLVQDMLTFDVLLEAMGTAVGGFGTYAGVSSLNTARISLDLPEGGTFTSASGLFLTAAGGGGGGVPPVPVPAPLLLLLSALGTLGVLRRRRKTLAIA